MSRKKDNFLDYVPRKNSLLNWTVDEKGIVTVDMVHDGFYAWVAHTFFKRPKVSHVALDTYGSYIWQQVDGTRTVYDIAELAKSRFGDAIEPLYPRIVQYMRTLNNNRFVLFKK